MILCVDGGGTKTHVIFAEENGIVISQGFGGSMLFGQTPHEEAIKSLNSAIAEASLKIRQQMVIFSRAVIGLAGIDTVSETLQARDLYTKALRDRVEGNIMVVNDMLIALLAGSKQNNAVVIIAGTGSSCFGLNQQGIRAKASGLDYLLSDEGSAFYIGQEILKAAIRSWDGRGKKTMLEDLVKQHYSVLDLVDIKEKIYGKSFNKSHIAKLSFLINQAAQANDEVAQQILQSAMKELAIAVKAVVAKLGIGRTEFDLVMIGGLFTSGTIHPQTFGAIIKNMYPQVSIIIPQDPPVYGALKLALAQPKQNDELSF